MTGQHLILNIHNILNNDLLKTVDGIKPLMEKIIKDLNLTVVGELSHQFKPYGATLLYLLSESHLSAHSFVDERCLTMDLYCCNEKINLSDAIEIVYKYFNGDCWISKKILER